MIHKSLETICKFIDYYLVNANLFLILYIILKHFLCLINFKYLKKLNLIKWLAREALKRRVLNYYGNVTNTNKNYLKAKKNPKSTFFSVIWTYLRRKFTQNLSKSARPKKLDKKTAMRLVKAFRDKDGCSQRVSAKKCNVSQATVGRYLNENSIDYFKKVKVCLFPRSSFLEF